MVLLPTATPSVQPITSTTAPAVLPVPTDEPPLLLIIPKANVGAQVIHVFLDDTGSWDISHLGNYVGALQGTAWIDHPGNIGLVGHVELRDGSPGIFAYLKNLTIGDEILLTQSGLAPWTYHVTAIRAVEPNDMSVLNPSTINMLTLITCENYDFLSNTYLRRTVVTALNTSSS